jgi:ADP-ribosylglycohydrolase
MSLPQDYVERVYAGVLGKIIGVYLGRPFEGWTYEKIMANLGEIWYYVHDRCGVPLIVTDDDISGTFTFLRALSDFGNRPDLTAAQIGQTWLNYLIENRTVLWWGGMGMSTEHTAYLRLKNGIPAPRSGAIATNGKVVAEQIGAQIFIDGWAMVAPGDPALAADLARRAGSVSHDGEAIYGAQVLAAMESQAFVESDINSLLDTALRLIPRDSVIYRMAGDVREWHSASSDWRVTREKIVTHYGYDKYGGNCHMVPNHALILLGLLYGDGDFQKSLMICNTAGWDTDCNSGNLGCLMGIRHGLAGIDTGPDWRGPLADRMYIPTADGGSCVTDAAIETYKIVNMGRALAGLDALAPKGGARFHFDLPGAVQGFTAENAQVAQVENIIVNDRRRLAIHYHHTAPGQEARVSTTTFLPPDALRMPGYTLFACPTLYPGQTVTAGLKSDANNTQLAACRLYIRYYGPGDKLQRLYGAGASIPAGENYDMTWRVPETGGYPIAEIGFEIESAHGDPGTLYLNFLTWKDAPTTTFYRPQGAGDAWRLAWVNGADFFDSGGDSFRVIQNSGTGLLIHGSLDWSNYRVEADLTPHMVISSGIAARVQGLLRYYALKLVSGNKARLVKIWYDQEIVLAEANFTWEFGQTYSFCLEAFDTTLTASIDGHQLFKVDDRLNPLMTGAVALACEEGRVATNAVTVHAL